LFYQGWFASTGTDLIVQKHGTTVGGSSGLDKYYCIFEEENEEDNDGKAAESRSLPRVMIIARAAAAAVRVVRPPLLLPSLCATIIKKKG